jgi:hypothetical protein
MLYSISTTIDVNHMIMTHRIPEVSHPISLHSHLHMMVTQEFIKQPAGTLYTTWGIRSSAPEQPGGVTFGTRLTRQAVSMLTWSIGRVVPNVAEVSWLCHQITVWDLEMTFGYPCTKYNVTQHQTKTTKVKFTSLHNDDEMRCFSILASSTRPSLS